MMIDLKYRNCYFALSIIRYFKKSKPSSTSRPLIDQLIRSATLYGASVAEGRSGSTKKGLIKYNQISPKSANETTYRLRLLRDGFELKKIEINELTIEADENSRILASSILMLHRQIKSESQLPRKVLTFYFKHT